MRPYHFIVILRNEESQQRIAREALASEAGAPSNQ
jgi:hypothetical protein